MNFCFVSALEIDSIIVTFDLMAIQRGLAFLKSILFAGITTLFQIARICTLFKVSSCIIYEKKTHFSLPTTCNKPHGIKKMRP